MTATRLLITIHRMTAPKILGPTTAPDKNYEVTGLTKTRKKSTSKSDIQELSALDPQINTPQSELEMPEAADMSRGSDRIRHPKQTRSGSVDQTPHSEYSERSEHSKRSGHSEHSGHTKSRSGKHINRTKSSVQPVSHGRPCVYILECKDGTLYTGWTNDFEKRFAAHSSGKGAKYTRGRGPLQPVYLEYLPDKIAATRREAAIKKLTRERKLALLKEATNSLNGNQR